MLNDPAIGWRSSCARFVIFWLDNIPHACDFYDPSRPYFAYTGTDPGRDVIAGTSDDIYWYPILRNLWMGDTLMPRVRESAYTSWVSFAPPYYTGITLWGSNWVAYLLHRLLQGCNYCRLSRGTMTRSRLGRILVIPSLLRRVIKGRYEFREIR
jgi:hypothetical protein